MNKAGTLCIGRCRLRRCQCEDRGRRRNWFHLAVAPRLRGHGRGGHGHALGRRDVTAAGIRRHRACGLRIRRAAGVHLDNGFERRATAIEMVRGGRTWAADYRGGVNPGQKNREDEAEAFHGRNGSCSFRFDHHTARVFIPQCFRSRICASADWGQPGSIHAWICSGVCGLKSSPIRQPSVCAIHYTGLLFFKLCVVLFNLVPFIVLSFIARPPR